MATRREVADCTAPALMEKEKMTDVELLVDIRKASCGRPDFANRPNHGAEIDRACMQHAIRNSDPGSLLVEDSNLKIDPKSSVCFDIPGGRKNRRREAADLGPDALMLCSDAAPADKDADAVADTADSYGEDPLPPPVRPPPPTAPTPGEVQSGSQRRLMRRPLSSFPCLSSSENLKWPLVLQ